MTQDELFPEDDKPEFSKAPLVSLGSNEKKPKRKKPVMLTGRSRKFLEREGYAVALVERTLNAPTDKTNPFAKRFINKFDAFGVADLAAVHPDKTGTLWIQVTDHAHRAEHVEKILAAKHAPTILKAENRIELHCWKSSKKSGQKRWCLRLQRVTLDISGAEKLWISDPEERWFRENMQEIEIF
jgi:hypothetical protein